LTLGVDGVAAKKSALTVDGSPSSGIQPPRKLGKHGLTLWREIHDAYRVDDYAGIELLMQACTALDRAEALAACVARDGETIKTKTGLRIHPAVREELAARAFICRTLERLGITSEAVKSPGRPSGFTSWTPDQ
jgi:hypothetical protein